MADRVDVKLKAKDPNNETTTTTISYVNPEASNSTMKQFAQKLNALTRNTYSESDKIETTNLDLAPDSNQQTPTFTLSQNTISATTMKNISPSGAGLGTLTYNGDAVPYAELPLNVKLGVIIESTGTANQYTLRAIYGAYGDPTACTIKIRADATENYKAAEATYTITE